MSVLRSFLTAGVLVSGLLWALPGLTQPAHQAEKGVRWEFMPQRNPDEA
ncbi:cytochrome C nitrite reductase, partial [Pectobacterium versatile]|nr:cytochrome C nitrite reductase [Pectobacterium versatile]